ncbi:PREDICTED: putative cysteine-rich repeat secretory protein 10 [Camelina sativa]|uniref:Cysteine-rich repeat secretory protein 10 n=1 Tax=Camelina sativa TaxID=90675 RepID=A0ABM0T064_CAMSA|nr:PREDICTED: putative cysteine-rich repeat secretory protein 10 [Camelina sativa]
MSSSSLPISILAVVAFQLPFIHSVLSLNQTNSYLQHICIKSEGTYKPESSYESELKRHLDYSISNYLDYGFIYGFTLKLVVQKEVYIIQYKQTIILRKCPNNKGRIIWYDNCFLYISTIYTYQKIDYKHYLYLHNAKDVTGGNTKLFNKNTRDLLYKLKEIAIRKEQKPYTRDYMYATAEESLGTMKLYGMMQCTQDLSVKNCSVCLDTIIAKLPKCCNGKQGGRVLNPSCTFRYELYPFVKT